MKYYDELIEICTLTDVLQISAAIEQCQALDRLEYVDEHEHPTVPISMSCTTVPVAA